jgi:hypothetical protein
VKTCVTMPSWSSPFKCKVSLYREAIVITNFKNELRSSIHMRIKIPEVLNLYKFFAKTILNMCLPHLRHV